MAAEPEEHGLYPRGFSQRTRWAWPLVQAKQLVTLNYGKALTESSRRIGGVAVYGTNGQCGWHDTPLREGPGVILGRKGQGPLGVEWCNSGYWVIDTAYFLTPNRPDVDLKFYYYLTKYVGLNHLKDGTSNPTLSRDAFGAQLFPVPPLFEQKVIAALLDSLDDKIQLNRRMNQTLDATARALFKSWFIDFDPVRAKVDGLRPNVRSTATADLFPSTFQDSQLGPIPRGWKVCQLGDCIDLKRGYDLPSQLRKPGTVPIVSSSGPSGFHSTAKAKAPGIVTGRYGTIGQVFFIEEEFWPLNTTLYVRDFKGHEPRFVLFLLGQVQFEDYSDKGAVPGVNRNHLHMEKLVVPSLVLEQCFSAAVEPLFKRRSANEREMKTLGSIRDRLLPKLLSGEIRIKDAERCVETTT
jgi:type I restriction enzyme, S subunit